MKEATSTTISKLDIEQYNVLKAQISTQPVVVFPYVCGEYFVNKKPVAITSPANHSLITVQLHKADGHVTNMACNSAVASQYSLINTPISDRIRWLEVFLNQLNKDARQKMITYAQLACGMTISDATYLCIDKVQEVVAKNIQLIKEISQPQQARSLVSDTRLILQPHSGFTCIVSQGNSLANLIDQLSMSLLTGYCVVWHPSETAILLEHYVYHLFLSVGFSSSFISFIPGDEESTSSLSLNHPDLYILSTTQSNHNYSVNDLVFQTRTKQIKSHTLNQPHLIIPTNEQNFCLIHDSATAENVIDALVMDAFIFQGQADSSLHRIFVPATWWPRIRTHFTEKFSRITSHQTVQYNSTYGSLRSQSVFTETIQHLKKLQEDATIKILAGGVFDNTYMYSVTPIMFQVDNYQHPILNIPIPASTLAIITYELNEFPLILNNLKKNPCQFGCFFGEGVDDFPTIIDQLSLTTLNLTINKPIHQKEPNNNLLIDKWHIFPWLTSHHIKEYLI